MNFEALEKELNTKILRPMYVFYGEETYFIENSVNKVKKIFGEKIDGINYILLDEENVRNVLSEINTPAFGYEKKLIILNKTNILKKTFKNKELQTRFENYVVNNIDNIKENIILIIIEEKLDKTKFVEFLEENAVCCNFIKLKPAQLAKRLKDICSLYKVEIQERDAMYLIEKSGTSMQNLINEIRKLIEYAGQHGVINKEAIDKLAISQLDSVIFDLTDEIGNKNINKSLEILNELIYQKESLQMILLMLYRHLKKIYLTKLSISEGKDVAETLELKPNQMFLVSKYKKQGEYFSFENLRKFLKDLTVLDQKNKKGLIDLEIGLETILCDNMQK